MYYLYIDDQQRGPFSIEQLAEMGITPETEVWTEGMSDWKQAGDVPALTTLLQRLEYERHSAAQAATTPPKHNPVPPVPPSWNETATTAPARQPEPKRKGGCTKWLIALLILLIVLGVLVVTVPDREAHRQAIVGSSREWVNDKVE